MLQVLGVDPTKDGIVKGIDREAIIAVLAPVYSEYVSHPEGLSWRTLQNCFGSLVSNDIGDRFERDVIARSPMSIQKKEYILGDLNDLSRGIPAAASAIVLALSNDRSHASYLVNGLLIQSKELLDFGTNRSLTEPLMDAILGLCSVAAQPEHEVHVVPSRIVHWMMQTPLSGDKAGHPSSKGSPLWFDAGPHLCPQPSTAPQKMNIFKDVHYVFVPIVYRSRNNKAQDCESLAWKVVCIDTHQKQLIVYDPFGDKNAQRRVKLLRKRFLVILEYEHRVQMRNAPLPSEWYRELDTTFPRSQELAESGIHSVAYVLDLLSGSDALHPSVYTQSRRLTEQRLFVSLCCEAKPPPMVNITKLSLKQILLSPLHELYNSHKDDFAASGAGDRSAPNSDFMETISSNRSELGAAAAPLEEEDGNVPDVSGTEDKGKEVPDTSYQEDESSSHPSGPSGDQYPVNDEDDLVQVTSGVEYRLPVDRSDDSHRSKDAGATSSNTLTPQTPVGEQMMPLEGPGPDANSTALCAFPSCARKKKVAKECINQMCPEHCRQILQEGGEPCVKHSPKQGGSHDQDRPLNLETNKTEKRIRKPSKKAVYLQDTSSRWDKSAL
ncbi:hypothetical protein FRB90_001541 [Tulasnella sp. 427]|nr:hypothetical protein FRB90_001541 [Tulasnella sp. 427]